MQASGLNSLLAILTPGVTPAGSGGLLDDGTTGGTDLFSQLLGNFDGSQTQGQTPGQNPNAGALAALLVPQATSLVNVPAVQSCLAAQEVSAVAPAVAPLNQLLAQSITPQDATKLLGQFDTAMADTDQGSSELWQQLKQQLTQLSQSDEPKTVAELVQSLDAAPVPAAQAAATHGAVGRVLQWLQATLTKSKMEQSPTQDDAADAAVPASGIDATAQSLQASLFRPGPAHAPADTDRGEDKQTAAAQTATVIVPMAQQVAVPQWVAAIAPEKPAVRDDLDQAIPPLVSNDKPRAALPDVDLPPTTADVKQSQAQANQFVQHLADAVVPSAPMAMGQTGPAKAAVAADKAEAVDAVDASANPVLNPSAAAGHAATQTANAVQPVALPAGIVNHAPVVEQVHVALSRASKDGIDQITLQLEPANLGRVEIKMHIAQDGTTQLTFTADKPETFDALSRDARTLEQSLQQSGIKADAGSMQFNLRQHPQPQFSGNFGQGQQNQQHASTDDGTDATVGGVEAITGPVKRTVINIHDGIDIHA